MNRHNPRGRISCCFLYRRAIDWAIIPTRFLLARHQIFVPVSTYHTVNGGSGEIIDPFRQVYGNSNNSLSRRFRDKSIRAFSSSNFKFLGTEILRCSLGENVYFSIHLGYPKTIPRYFYLIDSRRRTEAIYVETSVGREYSNTVAPVRSVERAFVYSTERWARVFIYRFG